MIDIESVLTIVNFSPAYTSGCVGIRCVFCKDLPDGEKAGQHGESMFHNKSNIHQIYIQHTNFYTHSIIN